MGSADSGNVSCIQPPWKPWPAAVWQHMGICIGVTDMYAFPCYSNGLMRITGNRKRCEEQGGVRLVSEFWIQQKTCPPMTEHLLKSLSGQQNMRVCMCSAINICLRMQECGKRHLQFRRGWQSVSLKKASSAIFKVFFTISKPQCHFNSH